MDDLLETSNNVATVKMTPGDDAISSVCVVQCSTRSSIVSAQQVARGKPHPDVYVEALSILDCQGCGQDAIVIEDSIHGIHAAAAAGIGHIAAVTTSLTHEQMYEALNHLKRSSFDAADGARQPEEDEASRVPLTRTCTVTIIGSTLPETFSALRSMLDM
eukprot:jgi/Picre1/34344/NNA_001816.t1